MLNNKQINRWFLAFSVCLLLACNTHQIPATYNTPAKEIKTDPYGCWADFVRTGTNESLSGELICVDLDTIFVLVSDKQIATIKLSEINSFEIYTHKNLSGKYAAFTLLYIAPSLIGAIAHPEFAGEFLALGIPAAAVGFTHVGIESANNKNVLRGTNPNNNSDFRLYARFPYGRPQKLDLNQLTLKKEGTPIKLDDYSTSRPKPPTPRNHN